MFITIYTEESYKFICNNSDTVGVMVFQTNFPPFPYPKKKKKIPQLPALKSN